jgi:hypothetical protein
MCPWFPHEDSGRHESVARLGAVLTRAGHVVAHWSTIGPPSAPDAQILAWMRDNGHILSTHDLDFGAILAAGGQKGDIKRSSICIISVASGRRQQYGEGAGSGCGDLHGEGALRWVGPPRHASPPPHRVGESGKEI